MRVYVVVISLKNFFQQSLSLVRPTLSSQHCLCRRVPLYFHIGSMKYIVRLDAFTVHRPLASSAKCEEVTWWRKNWRPRREKRQCLCSHKRIYDSRFLIVPMFLLVLRLGPARTRCISCLCLYINCSGGYRRFHVSKISVLDKKLRGTPVAC